MANLLLKRIKDWATSITAFRTGDYIAVDGPEGTAKMPKDDLLRLTAQNTLNMDVAPAFDQYKPNGADGYAYHVGELVCRGGLLYRFKENKTSGGWNGTKVDQVLVEDLLKLKANLSDVYVSDNPKFNAVFDGLYLADSNVKRIGFALKSSYMQIVFYAADSSELYRVRAELGVHVITKEGNLLSYDTSKAVLDELVYGIPSPNSYSEKSYINIVEGLKTLTEKSRTAYVGDTTSIFNDDTGITYGSVTTNQRYYCLPNFYGQVKKVYVDTSATWVKICFLKFDENLVVKDVIDLGTFSVYNGVAEIDVDNISFGYGIAISTDKLGYNGTSSNVITSNKTYVDVGQQYATTIISIHFKVEYTAKFIYLDEAFPLLFDEIKKVEKNNDFLFKQIHKDDFSNWVVIGNSSWDTSNNKLTPSMYGGYSSNTLTNAVLLDKCFQSNYKTCSFDVVLHTDTILNVHFTRGNTTGLVPNESMYRINCSLNRLEMCLLSGRYVTDNVGIYKNLESDIVDGRKYKCVVSQFRNKFEFSLIDLVNGERTTLSVENTWSYGTQKDRYGFSVKSGTFPVIDNFIVSEPCNVNAVFMGDSITEGYGLNGSGFGDAACDLLKNSLLVAASSDKWLNLSECFDSEVNFIKPKFIFITIGTNDKDNLTLANLETLISKAEAIGSQIYINHIPMLLNYDEQTVNSKVNQTGEVGALFDVATALNNDVSDGIDSSLFIDNTHPNDKGVKKMIERIKTDLPFIFSE